MPDEPMVVRMLREFREALGMAEDQLMLEMGRRWLEIEQRLEGDILALALEVERRKAAKETITQQMIWRSERYQKIKGQLQAEIRKYNQDYAIARIGKAQIQAGQLGLKAANDGIQAVFWDAGAVGPYWNRVNVEAVEAMAGLLSNGAPLRSLLVRDYPEALDGLVNSLMNGIARGLGPGAVAHEMVDGMGMGLDRAILIARTEMAKSYRMASTEQYRESGVVSGFRRLVSQETACIGCLMLDGETFDVESELDDHPAGKCIAVPIVKLVAPPQWTTGKEWFEGLDPEEQKARMGGERFELWKEGKFQLKDLARKSVSETWGECPRVATVEELVG